MKWKKTQMKKDRDNTFFSLFFHHYAGPYLLNIGFRGRQSVITGSLKMKISKNWPPPDLWNYPIIQQTPNPEAQFPSSVPPFISLHSDADRHNPSWVSSDWDVHWRFGKDTTDKNDNCPKIE